MTKQEEIINTIKVLRKEVEVLTKRLEPAGKGYLITAIDVINGRIDELIGSAINGQPDKIRDLTSEIYGEDVYDGYKEHTDGLSNRSMKQKYGHAIQTTSEMMQEELEPLPINTFK